MQSSSRTLSIGFVICSAALSAAHAAAPEAADASSDLSEVVVTGRAGVDQRTREETSYSITTIHNEKLRLQAPTSVTESLKSVPAKSAWVAGGRHWVRLDVRDAEGHLALLGNPIYIAARE